MNELKEIVDFDINVYQKRLDPFVKLEDIKKRRWNG